MNGNEQQEAPPADERSAEPAPRGKPRRQIDSTFSTRRDRAFEAAGKGLRRRHPQADDIEHIRRNREEPK